MKAVLYNTLIGCVQSKRSHVYLCPGFSWLQNVLNTSLSFENSGWPCVCHIVPVNFWLGSGGTFFSPVASVVTTGSHPHTHICLQTHIHVCVRTHTLQNLEESFTRGTSVHITFIFFMLSYWRKALQDGSREIWRPDKVTVSGKQ